MSTHTTRRRVLQLASTATVAAVAGCTGSGSGETVAVGPGGRRVFEPDSLEISTGRPVTFVWESSGHNIAVRSQPEGASWDGVDETQEEGFEHEHTFGTEGTYEYYCRPHEGAGMTGTISVVDDEVTGY